jgi:phosphoribosylaminoimidazolecarboxamide formyltransferase/IMP cyclohydrolase
MESYKKAFDADSISAFGGIVAFNSPVDDETAKALTVPFLECVVAPHFSTGAKEILSQKKNLRVLILKALGDRNVKQNPNEFEFKSLRGGALVESLDHADQWNDQWKIVGETPDENMKEDLIFAQRIVRHVKSNAIVVAKNFQTQGICGGQTNRVDSVKMALERAKGKGQNLILASDAFFPFRDSIDYAASHGVKWIIQPGGSLKDAEVEKAASEHRINMVITGARHFKH